MVKKREYGRVGSVDDIKSIHQAIRAKVHLVKSCKTHSKICDRGRRDQLVKLYRQGGYLVTLTFAPGWKQKFKGKIGKMRKTAKDEFGKTAELINRKADSIKVKGNFDTTWGK